MPEAEHHLDRERLGLLLVPVVVQSPRVSPGVDGIAGVAAEDVAEFVQNYVILVGEARMALVGDVVRGGGGNPEAADAGSGRVSGYQDDRSLSRTRDGRHVAADVPRNRRRVCGYQRGDVTSQTLDRVTSGRGGINNRCSSSAASEAEREGVGKAHPPSPARLCNRVVPSTVASCGSPIAQ